MMFYGNGEVNDPTKDNPFGWLEDADFVPLRDKLVEMKDDASYGSDDERLQAMGEMDNWGLIGLAIMAGFGKNRQEE